MPQTEAQLRFRSALSRIPDPDAAINEVINRLADAFDHIDFAIAFATPDLAGGFPQLSARLRDAFDASAVLAASMTGVVNDDQELESGPALSVLAGVMPGTTLLPFHDRGGPEPLAMHDPLQLAHRLQEQGIQPADARAVMLLADPFSTATLQLLPAFDDAFPGVPIIGGMASAASQPGDNRLTVNEQAFNEGCVGVVIAGDVHVQTTVSQGCRPVGRPMVITKCRRHIIQQLGGQPALPAARDMLRELSEDDQNLVQHGGLMVGRVIDEYKSRFGRGDFVIRSVVGFDPKAGFLAVGDPQIRVGQTIQFHVRDAASAADDLEFMLQVQRIHGKADGALLFTCNGRGTNLFPEPGADADAVRRVVGHVPLAGCFAAGEIGPVGGRTFLHGHTATLTAFRPPGPDTPDHQAD